MIKELKKKIRLEILAIRKAVSHDTAKAYSEKICRHINNFSLFQSSKNIGYYQSIHNEVSLGAIQKQNYQTFYLPKLISTQKMIFCKDEGPYIENDYGILEPQTPFFPVEQMDIVLIPLVGFDKHGHRLGMGKGYYDELFKSLQKLPMLIGVAYAFQQRQAIPYEAHDQSLDYIITEQGIWDCKKQCYDSIKDK
jgi:5-formyltetrahydrofolate cyclo-ligase